MATFQLPESPFIKSLEDILRRINTLLIHLDLVALSGSTNDYLL